MLAIFEKNVQNLTCSFPDLACPIRAKQFTKGIETDGSANLDNESGIRIFRHTESLDRRFAY